LPAAGQASAPARKTVTSCRLQLASSTGGSISVAAYGLEGLPRADRNPSAVYDDWVTPTITMSGHMMYGLNGDYLVWNHVTTSRPDPSIAC